MLQRNRQSTAQQPAQLPDSLMGASRQRCKCWLCLTLCQILKSRIHISCPAATAYSPNGSLSCFRIPTTCLCARSR